MSLAAEASTAKPKKGPPCGAGTFLASLTDEMRAEVLAVLHDKAIPDSGLVRALVNRGYLPPKAPTWGHHRRGECKCEPSDG